MKTYTPNWEDINNAVEAYRGQGKLHPLYSKVILQEEKMAPWECVGTKIPEIIILGEAPGNTEAKEGTPFVGRSGQLLRRVLEMNNIQNYALLNIMPLRPTDTQGKIRAPTLTEIEFFRPFVQRIIRAVAPTHVLVLGKSATNSMLLDWYPLQWQGRFGVIYHPAYYLRGNRNMAEDLRGMWGKRER